MAGAPAVSPVPGAAQYAQEATMANNAYNNALSQINKNRLNTLTQYGYTGTVDPTTGVVSGITVDPNAQYGLYQQQLQGAAAADKSALMHAQDRGLLGGLAHQGVAQQRYANQTGLTNMGENLMGSMDQFQQQQQDAGTTRDNALWQAEQNQLQAELTAEQTQTLEQLLNPGGVPAASGGSTGTGTVTGTGSLPPSVTNNVVQAGRVPAAEGGPVRINELLGSPARANAFYKALSRSMTKRKKG